MKLLIVPDQRPVDEEFQYIIESPCLDEERRFLESLWKKYEPYADKQFRVEIALNFHRRFWEMYLTCTLIEHGFELLPKSRQKGPDICVKVNSTWTWIEAIAPSGGEGPDAIFKPEFKAGQIEWFSVPDEKIILRYLSATITKCNGHNAYLNGGVIKIGDPYIIAVNGRRVPYSSLDLDDDVPYIVKVLLRKTEIIKANNTIMPTGIFLDKDYSGISGVLFSNSDLKNRPPKSGTEFIFVHNPIADNPLPPGWLPLGCEYWIEQDKILQRNFEK